MPLVGTKAMLKKAQEGGYAVGAFNVENLEMAQGVVAAAAARRAPVILQTTPSTVGYGSVWQFCALAEAVAREAAVPVAMHLDHGSTFALAAAAMDAGYTSVMIDGSHLPLEENMAVTRRVVEHADPLGVPVEAELGQVGGKEDDLVATGAACTDPDTAARFAEETGAHSLAVAIGTAHGVYARTPRLDVERLIAIRRRVSIPLVLHGASGLSKDAVRRCVAEGICKVNFATELRAAYTEGVRAVLTAQPGAFDPKTYGRAGRERVQAVAEAWMETLGCAGRG